MTRDHPEGAPPLTDEDLEYWEAAGRAGVRGAASDEGAHLGAGFVSLVAEVRRLRAEAKVRIETERFGFTAEAAVGAVVGSSFQQQELDRLRSDEWLERAAEEIEEKSAGGMNIEKAEGLAILRKHRDGER